MSAIATKTNGRAPRVIAPEPERPGSALHCAILAVQGAAPKLARNADGQIQSRSYRYVTLDAVVDAVLPLLVEQQLVWSTFPTTDEHGQPALRYQLTHIPSGESESDVMPLMCAKADPQGQGSALTYARRYALVAVLNLTTGDDDDGAAASQNGAQSEAPVSARPTAAPAKASERPASAKQRTMLEAKARAAELGAGELANRILAVAGEPSREWGSEEHAEQTLRRLLDRLPASLVTAVKEAIGS